MAALDAVERDLLLGAGFNFESSIRAGLPEFVHDTVQAILSGRYVSVLGQLLPRVLDAAGASVLDLMSKDNAFAAVKSALQQFIAKGSADLRDVSIEHRAFIVLCTGIVYLQLYAQANYTGPELSVELYGDLDNLHGVEALAEVNSDEKQRQSKPLTKTALQLLECDGEYPFRICETPECLAMARICFLALLTATNNDWKAGITLTDSTNTERNEDAAEGDPVDGSVASIALQACKSIRSSHWWSARAAVTHLRLLQTKEVPQTLLREITRSFARAIHYGEARNIQSANEMELATRYWIEAGLAEHHLDLPAKGKYHFARGKEVSGLKVELTGGMGRRTKYQKFDLAQMVLRAESAHPWLPIDADKSEQTAAPTIISTTSEEKALDTEAKIPEYWEVGEQMIARTDEGTDAAVRDVQMESVLDNILLERIAYNDTEFAKDSQQNLPPVDQCVLLTLCLDVENHNPQDGLTTEEMFPYIQRVLDNPNNWMVYSTALLQRSWIEYEQRYSRERAALQLQALLDQHTTKLTITQSTVASIESSAPVQERVRYLHSIVYPARYELQRDLAMRYLKMGVVSSALQLFEYLEMWDEVVDCYQILQKPQRAELVVRERLAVEESPHMLCALGDITNDRQYYDHAWEVSKHRLARAKRSLGRLAFAGNDYEACIEHMEASLAIQPLKPDVWFTLAISAMRLENWEKALRAFTRVTQQVPDNGEAWGNIAAVHMRRGNPELAYPALQEGLKYKRENWRMWENLLYVSMDLKKFNDVVYVMHRLLELREKSKRPVHLQVLRDLVDTVIDPTNTATLDEWARERLQNKVAELLGHITSTIRTEPPLWEIYAVFNAGLGKRTQAMDCRLKEYRAVTSKSGWEKELERVAEVVRTADHLIETHRLADATHADWYSCKMLLASALRKVKGLFENSEECIKLNEFVQLVESYCAPPKQNT